ncbi:uncharacterized protein LOC125491268 [Plutella xylostella]|uniref:uncharacterized protein LOC125491268 n=1 Tax=Plutella xylostella TaxID=51655 RepID=UPI0020331329|nr:uncharacterized protein LOC125491268 [Plutella xylostella]
MATAFDLALVNTYFQKKDEHLITYKSGQHATQIDYMLTRRTDIKKVKDCKVIPGEPLTSQHRLLVVELDIDLNRINYRQKHVSKTKWWLLQNENFAADFKDRIVRKIREVEFNENITVDDDWNVIANTIRESAKTVLGETKGVKKIEKETWWWNAEVQRALKDKKNAFKNWQEELTDDQLRAEKRQIYQLMKKKSKTSVAIARSQVQEELYKQLEKPEGQKALFRLARNRERNAKDMIQIRCMKDENGRVLTKDEEIKVRWKSYFEQLLNVENDRVGLPEPQGLNLGMVDKINEWEVKLALRKMGNGKAVGPDNIPVEVWKLLGDDGIYWLTYLFNKIFAEESIPTDWRGSYLVPIYKEKGDIQDCGNYRGIKLMAHTMKLYEKVIESRIRRESTVSANQFGFMPGRSTTDAIFAVRQLMEKFRAVQRNLHMVFIDLEKAYDRVPRDLLWRCLQNKGVPVKYISIVQDMYAGANTQVRTAVGVTDRFEVRVGVHQGSSLSPYLFLLVMDALTSAIQKEAPWCMLFADDIVLVDESGDELQVQLNQWRDTLESVGLRLSRTKTEYMFCQFGGPTSAASISLGTSPLAVGEDFRYLGSLLQSDGSIDRDVTRRMNAGWMKWKQLTGTTCDRKMPIKIKGKIYKSVIRPVMLYGAECWATKVCDEKRMHVTEMRMLRWMCGVTRKDRIRNEYNYKGNYKQRMEDGGEAIPMIECNLTYPHRHCCSVPSCPPSPLPPPPPPSPTESELGHGLTDDEYKIFGVTPTEENHRLVAMLMASSRELRARDLDLRNMRRYHRALKRNLAAVERRMQMEIEDLKRMIAENEALLLLNDVQIRGLRERRGEDPVALAVQAGAALGVRVPRSEVVFAERVGSPRYLFERARALARLFDWRYVWTRGGRVFLRRRALRPKYMVRTERDLQLVLHLASPDDGDSSDSEPGAAGLP